jgi:anti-anti-sigma regulatory factor
MSIEVRRRGLVQIVEVSGDDPVRERIEALIDEGENLMVVDLTKKPELDSVVLGQLVACREHARRHDGVIKLVVTAGQRELVVATRLDYLFETFKDEEEALDSFQPSDTTAGIP